ncbi:MAG TPA: potassium transporter TrkG [Cyclobacteriaceae bacterium]|nr:potassium transporter TrkG [Cyclobacteriaceae bacterium]
MKWPRLPRFIARYRALAKWLLTERVSHQARFLISTVLRTVLRVTDAAIPAISLLLMGVVIYDVGFRTFYSFGPRVYILMAVLMAVLRSLMIARFIAELPEKRKLGAHIFNFGLVALTFYLYDLLGVTAQTEPLRTNEFLFRKLLLYGGILFIFSTEASDLLRFVYRRSLNPAFLFVVSFASIILVGTLLLMLPRATYNGISPVDALFTATSAVCVTGLMVVDTATHFTLMGKIILLSLIQVGGLGIMTFTALLGYLAAGSVSIQSQVALKDMLYSRRINNVIQLVTRIIVVTFFFEFLGVILINWGIGDEVAVSKLDRLFFSIFHSVSAFCNAGFSTLPHGLYEMPLRYNYTLHLTIAALVVLGGMGFPITFNLFSLIRVRATNFVRNLLKSPKREHYTRIVHVSSKLAITTSAILLAFGFLTYLIFEQKGTLAQHPTAWGKVVTALFGAVTPRTAGFNTVNFAAMTLPTVMVYLLLMWIGASPGSTGGGIKTTTAAVAVLNVASVIRRKNRTEVFRTQITEGSINRAFAIIVVSLLVMGLAVLLIGVNDSDKGMLQIGFEVFAAFSTAGITLGITKDLSMFSQVVLIFVMFIGRVGVLTILMALVHQVGRLPYQYPREDIMF